MKRNLRIGILAVAIAAALCGGTLAVLCFLNTWRIDLTLQGAEQLQLEFGEGYQEPGATARFSGTIFQRKGVALSVERTGSVDTATLGSYALTYTAQHKGVTATAQRTVTVVDSQPPEITLFTEEGSYTLPGESYAEEGFSAIDNYDGDLTDQVVAIEQDGIVTYTVTDSSSNVATAQRTIYYNDPVPPELTLLGDTQLSFYAGGSYEEPGYLATDNVDGDLTDQVVVSGEVNPLLAGTYTLTYSVTDHYGNTTQATRTIQVNEVPVQQTTTQVPADKVVYLTFDDGPGPYTSELLDILDKYNVKATFFVTAGNTKYLDLIAQEAAAGHSIGIHSYTHDYSQIYVSDSAFFADLNAMGEIIAAQTGRYTNLMRFPGGSSNEVSKKYCTGIMSELVVEVADQGYTYFDWNVTSGDAGDTKDTQTIIDNVISGIQSHSTSVVLQHDTKSYSVAAVESIIQWGLENGYTFLPLESSSFAAHHSVHN